MKTLSGNLTIKKTSISLTLLYLPSMFKLIQFSDFKGYLLCGIATLVRLVVKSTQYKKLAPNALRFTYLANHMKKLNKKHQNAKSIGEQLKTKGLMFFVSFFFM